MLLTPKGKEMGLQGDADTQSIIPAIGEARGSKVLDGWHMSLDYILRPCFTKKKKEEEEEEELTKNKKHSGGGTL